MCILCVVQKWARKVVTMLPWIVIPLVILWAFSQLLPPGFRFEVTSPRLACVLVLLVTLFWYEVLMPQLSAWRAKRSALLRERMRFEAIEMQKLRKMATRRCRNCLTPYRDQNPGGGRFMCSYCGHISKRPVLDMPGGGGGGGGLSMNHDPRYAGLSIANSGIIGDLVSKSGKIWNGKVWLDNGWIGGGQESLDNGNWNALSSAEKSGYQGKNKDGYAGNEGHCWGGDTCSGLVSFGRKLLSSILCCIRWIARTVFRVSLSGDDTLSEAHNKGMMSKKGENGMGFHESRGERARRKAEEKRQARLERELLAEEERKQREEVARLVEERRKLRGENTEAEKEYDKGSTPEQRKDNKKEAERKRQERRKDKDKGSNKSNSDVEDLDRRASRESEKKRVFEKRNEIDRRDVLKSAPESVKTQNSEACTKTNSINNVSKGNRYFDRVKGSIFSSPKVLNGGSFFGKGTNASANVVWKVNKHSSSGDHAQTASNLKDANSPGQVLGKVNTNGGDRITDGSFRRPLVPEQQSQAAPKKSWQQLFTRTAAAPASSNANVAPILNQTPQIGAERSLFFGQVAQAHPIDNQIHFGTSLPYVSPSVPSFSSGGYSIFSSAAPLMFSPPGIMPAELTPEESELFEDPCYVPDPVSLLGPVSESLDLASGFVPDVGLEKLHSPKYVAASDEVSRPSPIESPMSRLRLVEEKFVNSSQVPGNPKIDGKKSSLMSNSSNEQEQGTWQMWGTPPLGQDGLGLIGGSANWILPLGQNQLNRQDGVHSSSQFVKENQVYLGSGAPQNPHLTNCNNVATSHPRSPCFKDNENGPWPQKTAFGSSGDAQTSFTPFNLEDAISESEVSYGSPSGPVAGSPFDPSPTSFWSKKDLAVHGSGEEGVGHPTLVKPCIGGLFSTPDVQSVWSFN
ncbi:hypothetical protein Scep_005828 [Stephania cephalantha]|uniref:Uncharacterized protein n=1 Tax=Stephania cephalantha TaxID=152367 RepID=A0AAP0KYF4_9MAGN